ncbi:histone-lysine N-methyltransferase SETMAR [Trichonephila clavata]|uniref:Histone-lysine N-methyltransferase SETMAR n=1 Tax=Trichonephila clavata TaxID=2740835 RepID=A0A8X6KI98_TRICU|nr:histone-lysine N-methyltransferase SETMAR [Trichonephila clavata]
MVLQDGPDTVSRHVSIQSITQKLKIDHKTVLNHLYKAGFKKKLDVWVPHQLSKNMMGHISSCKAIAKRNKIDPFLQRMVTGDENVSHTTLCRNDRGQRAVT